MVFTAYSFWTAGWLFATLADFEYLPQFDVSKKIQIVFILYD